VVVVVQLLLGPVLMLVLVLAPAGTLQASRVASCPVVLVAALVPVPVTVSLLPDLTDPNKQIVTFDRSFDHSTIRSEQ